jgi:hypothetical protein
MTQPTSQMTAPSDNNGDSTKWQQLQITAKMTAQMDNASRQWPGWQPRCHPSWQHTLITPSDNNTNTCLSCGNDYPDGKTPDDDNPDDYTKCDTTLYVVIWSCCHLVLSSEGTCSSFIYYFFYFIESLAHSPISYIVLTLVWACYKYHYLQKLLWVLINKFLLLILNYLKVW